MDQGNMDQGNMDQENMDQGHMDHRNVEVEICQYSSFVKYYLFLFSMLEAV